MEEQPANPHGINSPIVIAILGAIAAVVCVIIGYFLTKGPMMIVSYKVFPMEEYSTSMGAGGIASTTSTVNSSFAPTLVLHRAQLWSSGDETINSLKCIVAMKKGNRAIRLLWVGHDTEPKLGFGEIKDPSSRTLPAEIEYEYLNPRDGDNLLIVTDERAEITILPRGKGVMVKEITVGSLKGVTFVLSILAVGVAAFVILLVFRALAGKRAMGESS